VLAGKKRSDKEGAIQYVEGTCSRNSCRSAQQTRAVGQGRDDENSTLLYFWREWMRSVVAHQPRCLLNRVRTNEEARRSRTTVVRLTVRTVRARLLLNTGLCHRGAREWSTYAR